MSMPPDPPVVVVPPHRPTDDAEHVYFDGSPLLRAEMASVLAWGSAAIVVLAIVVGNATRFHVRVPGWGYAVAVLLAAVFLAMPWLVRRGVRYRITNYRIDVTRGLLSRNVDTLELWHVEDLRLHQSVFDRIVGVGTITVLSHTLTPSMVLRGLPGPQQLFRELEQRVIAVKRQSGVVKMDVGQ
jgi:hypothetical protein